MTIQVTKGLGKEQVANLPDVGVRIVRRVTRLTEVETGFVVRKPVSKGPRWLLDGIYYAVLW